jgi:hypothetical protein
MVWPLRLRAAGFAITVGVVLMESALASMPIGVALCYFAGLGGRRAFSILAPLALVVALAIAIHGDLGRQGYRKWWRSRA